MAAVPKKHDKEIARRDRRIAKEAKRAARKASEAGRRGAQVRRTGRSGLGSSPWKAARQLSDEQRQAMRERARNLAAIRADSAARDDKSSTSGAGMGAVATPTPEAA